MKRNQRNFENMLERSFGCSETVPRDKVDSAWKRVLRGFQEQASTSGDAVVGPEPIYREGQWTATWLQSAFGKAAIAVLAISSLVLVRNLLHDDVQAFVETAASGLQRVVAGKTEDLLAGERLAFGEIVHSNSGSESVIVLRDKSRIEMRSKSELVLEAADDGVRIQLNAGSVIVTAAKQRTGHLYVRTRDLTASVVGTVFVVSTEEAGSRVAVLQGEVRVRQGGDEKELLPGQQMATNPLMGPRPIDRAVSWSDDAEMHLALLLQVVRAAYQAPPKNTREFETVSIRPGSATQVGDGNTPVPLRCSGADGILELIDPAQATIRDVLGDRAQGGASLVPRGRCIGRTTLADLIGLAYGLRDTRLLRPSLLGGEPWMYRTPEGSFEIEAKAEDLATVTKSQLQQMLQSILVDRFKLKVSWQTKEFQGFVMYSANDRAKLPIASGEEALKQVTRIVGNTEQRVITGKASMEAFLDFISIRPPLRAGGGGDRIDTILDRTDLKEIYSFNLSYAVPPAAPSGGDGQRGGGAGYVEGFSPALPNMRDALREQLGLRLESAKVPMDYIVIEHAEKPSEN
jgi:uncharacterized protein (TIGR03435 family)